MRAFVFESAASTKAIAVLECQDLDAERATVPGHVRLASLKPKMVLRPATDAGKPDMSAMSTIVSVHQGTEGSPSKVLFAGASKSSGSSKKKEEDQSK